MLSISLSKRKGCELVIAIFSANPAEARLLHECLPGHDLRFYSQPLDIAFAARDEAGEIEALCVFVHDRVSADIIAGLPRLRLIVTRSTGYDHIDLESAEKAGVTISNVPSYGENTVAEFTFALLLALSRNLYQGCLQTKAGEFRLHDGLKGWDLKGKTIGIVGTGHIGLHVARIARGFWMKVLAVDPLAKPVEANLLGFEYTTLEDLLERSDVVTLHAPLTPGTRHLIDARALARMKPSAVLINTGRGTLVDSEALIAALDSGCLRGAALDVLEDEEALCENGMGEARLRGYCRPNLLLTPHMAFDSAEAVERILETTVENIRAFEAGRVQNCVPVG